MEYSQNEKIIKVVLSQTENLLNYVKEQIDNWLQLNVKNSGARWFHIHKGIDLLYINAEGYNTPPLTRLELDIENIDSISAKKVSEFVYLYLKNQFGIEEQSEYLTYDTHNLYFKEAIDKSPTFWADLACLYSAIEYNGLNFFILPKL